MFCFVLDNSKIYIMIIGRALIMYYLLIIAGKITTLTLFIIISMHQCMQPFEVLINFIKYLCWLGKDQLELRKFIPSVFF